MYKRQIVFFTFLIMLISAFFFGCKQDKFDAGLELIPDSLRIKTSAADTLEVVAYTYKSEEKKTNNTLSVLLGSYNDPIFGSVNASFVTEMLISIDTSANNALIKSNNRDSLVIYFRFPLDSASLKHYGDYTKDCSVDVMRINKLLNFYDKDDEYKYGFDATELNADLITSVTFNPLEIFNHAEFVADTTYENARQRALLEDPPADTSKIERPEPVATLSIKLPDSFKDQIYSYLVSSISDNATMVELFNGFYLTPNQTNEGISIFDYNDIETKAVLYYNDTSKYMMGFNSTATHFNIYDHDNSTGNILADLDNPENKVDSVVYIQGIDGFETKITFPELDELINQGLYAVNKAELILPVVKETVTDYYPVPESLKLELLNESGEKETLSVIVNGAIIEYAGTEYIDGEYKFDLTYYMQQVFSGKYVNNGFFISIPDEIINPSRVVLTNGNHSNRMKLVLVLTELYN